MPRFIKILSHQQKMNFDAPPVFSGEQRKHVFTSHRWVLDIIKSFRRDVNKIGFMLQLGYFRAANRFYSSKSFHSSDIRYIINKLKLSGRSFNYNDYNRMTMKRHREIILKQTGYISFSKREKQELIKESNMLASKQLKPRYIFMSLIDYLDRKKVQIPSYSAIAEIITDSINKFEDKLVQNINQSLSNTERECLDGLLTKNDDKNYLITKFKSHNHSIKLKKIRKNMESYKELESMFFQILPIAQRLELSPEVVRYYSEVVIKSQVFQIGRRDDKRYLYLISFIIDSFYKLSDMLAFKLKKAVQQALNSGVRIEKDTVYERSFTKNDAVKSVVSSYKHQKNTVNMLWEIMLHSELSMEDKFKTAVKILQEEQEAPDIDEHIAFIDEDIARASRNADYYDSLEKNSRKLQNKVSAIIKSLYYDETTSNPDLMEAIRYFKAKDGHIDNKSPLDVFNNKEMRVMYDENGNVRVSLYKILLFIKISNGIKSGALNLLHSYEHKSFEDYLIPLNKWQENRESYLERSGLSEFKEWRHLEKGLRKALKAQYKKTNNNIENGVNNYIKIDSNGKLRLKKYEINELSDDIIDLYPKDDFISIYEILTGVSNMSGFLSSFEHFENKYNRAQPDGHLLMAGIIGYGCNLGINKIAKISKNINENQLLNAVKWYFTQNNINDANDVVVRTIGDLSISQLTKNDKTKTHTSSDGQKFSISVESVNAGKSFKYFGMDDGLVVNSFIDDSSRLFYSTVISPAEREAAYTIDGLLHNNVVKSDIHSTDTHGYNEIIFGVSHLLGISFAPRIKDFSRQYLYSFGNVADVKKLGYQIVPRRKINTKIINDNWDNILRLIATLRTKEVTASQLFKRLSSYSREHPVYRALKEFGKIIKTLFLLKYIDDVKLRKQIQKMMNLVESSNKLANAVHHGNNRQIRYAGKNEQLIAEGCKRLIENAIICWNYAYLTKVYIETQDTDIKDAVLTSIKSKSAISWEHINLHGTYDFSEEILDDRYQFDFDELQSVNF